MARPGKYQRTIRELRKAFDFVFSVDYKLPKKIRKDTLTKLKEDYNAKVREQRLKEEQRRIKQQM